MTSLSFRCFQNPHEKYDLPFIGVKVKNFLVPFIVLALVVLLSFGNN